MIISSATVWSFHDAEWLAYAWSPKIQPFITLSKFGCLAAPPYNIKGVSTPPTTISLPSLSSGHPAQVAVFGGGSAGAEVEAQGLQ